MDWNNLLQLIGALMTGGVITTFFTLRSTRAAAAAAARKTELENVREGNDILMSTIVNPLREEMKENTNELKAVKNELTKLRKAIDKISLCPHRAECPVLDELQREAELAAR